MFFSSLHFVPFGSFASQITTSKVFLLHSLLFAATHNFVPHCFVSAAFTLISSVTRAFFALAKLGLTALHFVLGCWVVPAGSVGSLTFAFLPCSFHSFLATRFGKNALNSCVSHLHSRSQHLATTSSAFFFLTCDFLTD